MPWGVIAAVATAAYAAKEQELASRRQQRGPAKRAYDSVADMVRAHNAKMASEHAWTMRQAKVGTILLIALVLASALAVADWAGWLV